MARKLEVHWFGIDGGFSDDICNFRCCYCGANNHDVKKTSGVPRFYDALDHIDRVFDSGGGLTLNFAMGEITVAPWCGKALDLIYKKGWYGFINSNARIYNEKIAELMGQRRVSLRVSLDAGTPETFNKIKGFNCFGTVVDNCEKYAATGGRMTLKYILLEGINDNDKDAEGFINITKKLKTRVELSHDLAKLGEPLSKKTIRFMRHILDSAVSSGLPVWIDTNMFRPAEYNHFKDYFDKLVSA